MGLSTILLLSLPLLLFQTPNSFVLSSNLPADEEIKVFHHPQHKIYHPKSNSCISKQGYEAPTKLAPCEHSDFWNYTPQKFLTVVGTYYCLKAVGPSLPAKLSIMCDVSDSQWITVSDSDKTHFSTKLEDGNVVCLDVDDENTIVTNPCRSFNNGDSQWFQFKLWKGSGTN